MTMTRACTQVIVTMETTLFHLSRSPFFPPFSLTEFNQIVDTEINVFPEKRRVLFVLLAVCRLVGSWVPGWPRAVSGHPVTGHSWTCAAASPSPGRRAPVIASIRIVLVWKCGARKIDSEERRKGLFNVHKNVFLCVLTPVYFTYFLSDFFFVPTQLCLYDTLRWKVENVIGHSLYHGVYPYQACLPTKTCWK